MVVVGALVVVGLFVCLARRNLFRCVRLLILDGLEVPDALLSVVLVGFVVRADLVVHAFLIDNISHVVRVVIVVLIVLFFRLIDVIKAVNS